jgi:hypothetical protein
MWYAKLEKTSLSIPSPPYLDREFVKLIRNMDGLRTDLLTTVTCDTAFRTFAVI